MKFTVSREKWLRGNPYHSCLLSREGLMCCLGQVGEQCGVPHDKMLQIQAPQELTKSDFNRYPKWIVGERDGKVDCSTAAYDAMRANDDPALPDGEREAAIAYIFSRNGDEIEFVD